MHKRNGVKWGVLAVMLILTLSLCVACGYRTSPKNLNADNNGTHVIEGYIVDFSGNRVTIDQVEFLTSSSTARINELGLDTNRDFRNGYYAYNDSADDRQTYTVANDVQVRLAGTGADGWYNGAQRNAALNNVSGYTPNNTAVGINNDLGTGSIFPNGTAGTVNPVPHAGYTLGGTAGGILGGVDLLSNRYNNTTTINSSTPYFITIKDGYVTSIEEVSAFSNFAGSGTSTTTSYPTTNGYSPTYR